MTEKHWAIFALEDIKNALDDDSYDVASCYINSAIAAIVAQDDPDADLKETIGSDGDTTMSHRI